MNNILSLVLGLAAWVLPVVYLMVWKHRTALCGGSLACCALSLYFQLREILRRTELADFAAIDDTIGGICLCATVLLAATLTLNAIALLRKDG